MPFLLGVSWTVAKGRLDGDESEGKLTAAEDHATTMVGIFMIEECYYSSVTILVIEECYYSSVTILMIEGCYYMGYC